MDFFGSLTLYAFQYGPFFFAVCAIFIAKYAYDAYITAPPDSEQLKTHRWHFIFASLASLILVIASSIWWFVHPPSSISYFEGTIYGLKPHHNIASEELYFRKYIPFNNFDADTDSARSKIRYEHFLIVSEKPFDDKTKFRLQIQQKGSNFEEDLTIEYKLGSHYEVVFDNQEEKFVLNPISSDTTRLFLPLLESVLLQSAYAEEVKHDRANLRVLSSSNELENLPVGSYEIKALQSEETDVGKKIDLLRELRKKSDEKIEEYLKINTDKEPMALTILDLSRHTDAQLAKYANSLLSRFDLASYIGDELHSKEENHLEIVKNLLSRFDNSRRESLLSTAEITDMAFLTGIKPRVLIPTGSRQGDQYYVRASWNWNSSQENNEQDIEVFNCLTGIFNEELITERTLEEERILMERLQRKRFVYWYSKEWALQIANKIENCGGESAFVNGITFEVPAIQ